MQSKINKWVIAAIAAVKSSGLADMNDPQDVARMCEFFGFHVAYLWIMDHSDAYLNGMRHEFDAPDMLTSDEADHAMRHIAVVLSVRGNDLISDQDVKGAASMRSIVSENLRRFPAVHITPPQSHRASVARAAEPLSAVVSPH